MPFEDWQTDANGDKIFWGVDTANHVVLWRQAGTERGTGAASAGRAMSESSGLATIRLENFRDGLEDYAYVRVLESLVGRITTAASRSAEQEAWLQQAREALQVPEELSKSLTEYTSDPQVVYRWRTRLAETIRQADLAPDDDL